VDGQEKVLLCHSCGGEIEASESHGGVRKMKCRSCGRSYHEECDRDIHAIYGICAFCDTVVKLMGPGNFEKRKKKGADWENHAAELESYIEQYGGQWNENPFFAICYVAYRTKGFCEYPSDPVDRNAVEDLYKVAKDSLIDRESEQIKIFVERYEKLRNRRRNTSIRIFSVFAAVCVLILTVFLFYESSYSPIAVDPVSGISVSIPNDAVFIFDKLNVKLDVETAGIGSAPYIDAKNALRNETETFALYDISLLSGQNKLNFDGSVTVEIPIPEEFDIGCLKIYHIISDESYEEIPSRVSAERNTIAFDTSHFSYFAVAERNPIVSFDTVGAGDIKKVFVMRDSLMAEPEPPQKTGYTFGGWMSDGVLWDFSANTVKKDLTLTAVWIPNCYTITLNACGGLSDIDTIDVFYMSNYEDLPVNVQKKGYTFIGWFTSAEGGVLVTNQTVFNIPQDQTLYAHFQANTNQIRFDANGGEGEMSPMDLKTNASLRLPAVSFVKNGYVFAGWSTAPGGKIEYEDKDFYTMGENSEYVLYAVWRARTNTVRFESNGGIGEMENIFIETDQSRDLPANTFIRPGYTFIGWSTSADGEAVYENLGKYVMGKESVNVLYAVWQINTNTVILNPNGGVGTMDNLKIATGTSETLPLCAFTRRGYTFKGWSDTPDGKVIYVDGASYLMGTASEYTLYAVWEIIDYRIVFDANGGQDLPPIVYTVEDSAFGLPGGVRPGYTFKGWFDAHGNRYETVAKGSVGNLALRAEWQINTNTVILNPNGGVGTMDNLKIATGMSETLPLCAFTRRGYTFKGWSTASDGKVIHADGASYLMGTASEYTLYAVWEAVDYRIVFDANGGQDLPPIVYTVEDSAFDLPGGVRPGYTFKGWFDEHGNRYETVAKGSAGDLALKAEWQAHCYRVVYHANGGNGRMEASSHEYGQGKNLSPNTFTRLGYDFAGWSLSENGKVVYGDGAEILNLVEAENGEAVLYAQWEPKMYVITFITADGTPIAFRQYKYGEKTSLPIDPKRDGFDFAGWRFDVKSFSFGDSMPASDITATALWTYKTVRYDSGYSEKRIDASKEYTYDIFDISSLSRFMNDEYVFSFTVEVYMKEIEKGYQEIYVCKGDQTHVAGIYDYEYGGPDAAHKKYSWVSFQWSVGGESCTETMLLRYGAHGNFSDDWMRAQAKVTVTVLPR